MTISSAALRIAVGADDAGLGLKSLLAEHVTADGRRVDVVDMGVTGDDDHRPYPDIGLAAAEAVARGEVDRALLVCGTGIGMAISANKVPGVRATVAHDSYSVERSVLSNNCQVLALGARVVGPELAKRLVSEWLELRFDTASPSAEKVERITAYERDHRAG